MYVYMGEHMEGPLEGWTVEGVPESVVLDVEADCYWWVGAAAAVEQDL